MVAKVLDLNGVELQLIPRLFSPSTIWVLNPEGTPKKLCRGVRLASQNPYPIYDQNLQPRSQGFFLFVTRDEKEIALGTRLQNLRFSPPSYNQNLRIPLPHL